jgi:hypothetical protein
MNFRGRLPACRAAAFLGAGWNAANAKTLVVNPAAMNGCFAAIRAPVAAKAGDPVTVAPEAYIEPYVHATHRAFGSVAPV